MRVVTFGFGLILACGASFAQPADMTKVISLLDTEAKQKVAWNIPQAKHVDVTCDGTPDTVMFGYDRKSVWVGVVSGSDGATHTTKFPRASALQDGFPAVPAAISLYPHICVGPEDQRLSDCKPAKACSDFSLAAGDTDPFNFYWDDKHKTLSWWRN